MLRSIALGQPKRIVFNNVSGKGGERNKNKEEQNEES
jgi:hypothetical protein